MHTQAMALLHLETDGGGRSKRQEFRLHYYRLYRSPKVGLAVLRPCSAAHPQRACFRQSSIPVAEETGLTVPYWLVGTVALRQMRAPRTISNKAP